LKGAKYLDRSNHRRKNEFMAFVDAAFAGGVFFNPYKDSC
jgi:hypothetical protein